jgi:hypothetical protein
MSDFIFTRYLYEKEEVGYSLVFSLLNKKEEESIFWATELYYSGFEEELYEFLWIIYQNFYASLNSRFEHYLLKKIELLKKSKTNTSIIHLHLIIKNLIIRPYNLDTFSLIILTTDFEIENLINTNEYQDKDNSLKQLLTLTPNYLQIAKLLLDDWREKDEIFIEKNMDSIIDFFNNTNISHMKSKPIEKKNVIKDFHKTIQLLKSNGIDFSPSSLLLTRILNLYSILNKLKIGKILTLIIPEESIESEINKYKNIETHNQTLKPNKILQKARIYSINPQINDVFKLKRNQSKIDIKTAFRENWLYHTSFSPLWKSRIHNYNGTISKDERKIIFEKEEDEEEFYLRYGYEPDEQSKECQEKSIASFAKSKFKEWIENEYKKSTNRLYQIEEEYLDEL